MAILSYTQFDTFAGCPRRWQLSKRYEPKRKAVALHEGDLWHILLAKLYTQKKPPEAFRPIYADYVANLLENREEEERQKIVAKTEMLWAVFECYYERIALRDFDLFEIVKIEYPLKMEFPGGDVMVGTVDGLWRHKPTGVLFLVEHKYRDEHDEDLMALDFQISDYTMLLIPEYGLLPTLYNVTRKPLYRIGKGETMEAFVERVKKEIKKEFTRIGNDPLSINARFAVRQVYSRGRQDLKVAHAQNLELHRRMKEVDADPSRVYRNVGQECLYLCPFKPICLEEDPIVVDAMYVRKRVERPPEPSAPVKSGEKIIV